MAMRNARISRRKVAGTTTTDYAGNYMYKNGTLQFFNHPEGYVENNAGTYKYHYQYKDHLGNIRLSYFNNGTATSPILVISEENNYYPFGLRHKGYNDAPNGYGNSAAKMFKFGGKEYQEEEFGGKNLDWYDFHARNYNAALGRWMNVDPLAENFYGWSPYNYTYNNPLNFIDPTGLGPEDIIIRAKDVNDNYQEILRIKSNIVCKTIDLNITGPILHEPGSNAPIENPLEIKEIVRGVTFDDFITQGGMGLADAWSIDIHAEFAKVIGGEGEVSLAGFLNGPDSGKVFAYGQLNLLHGLEKGGGISVSNYFSQVPISQFGFSALEGFETGAQGSVGRFGGSGFQGIEYHTFPFDKKVIYNGFSLGYAGPQGASGSFYTGFAFSLPSLIKK